MSRMAQVVVVLALLVLAVTHAAPVQDEKKETVPENAASTKATDTLETDVEPKETTNSEEEKTSEETKEEAVPKEEPEPEGSGLASEEKEEPVAPNVEVTNYQDIEGDNDNYMTNGNSEVSYTDSVGDDFGDYRLSEEDAMELLRELSDPAQVAVFIMESEDTSGFLRSVQLLLDQGYISQEDAFFLKEAVSRELEQLLMMEDQEMYGDPLGLQNLENTGNDYVPVDEMLNRPVPYFPTDYFDNAMPYQENNIYPDSVDYLFQQPYSEETMALSEIANIVADQIENGQMSTARGERIIDILSQLLPEGFWQDDDISDEMMQDLGQAFAELYPALPVGDQYRTFETEQDEPLPGGERHTKEEVVVDQEGRPVAERISTEEEQKEEKVLGGDNAEELERELLEMEPETPDDIEKALQDVEKMAPVVDQENEEEDREETKDETDNSGWKDLVLLLDEGKISDELLNELGITRQELKELTEPEQDENDENTKP